MIIPGFAIRAGIYFIIFDLIAALHDCCVMAGAFGCQHGIYCSDFQDRFPQKLVRRHVFKPAKCRIDEDITPLRVLAENAGGHLVNERMIERLRFAQLRLNPFQVGDVCGDAENLPAIFRQFTDGHKLLHPMSDPVFVNAAELVAVKRQVVQKGVS